MQTASTPASSAAKAPPPDTRAATAGASSSAAGTAPLSPPGSGRQAIQSAQLQLATSPNEIDQVAQEAFDVIGAVRGYVDNSTVTQTGGSDGSANLSLTVPAASLAQTMTQLSQLAHARVTAPAPTESRT